MNLYDQLLALQEIPDAYACWSDYRKALTEYIIKQIDKPQRVLILGVGRGNDLALDKLLHYATSLTLWDKDKGAIQEALVRYGLSGNPKINAIEKDLLGLKAEDYRLYADELIQYVRIQGMQTDVEALVSVGLKAVQELSQKIVFTKIGEKSYDTVIMLGMHSQLLSMMNWIWQVILQTIQKEETKVSTFIMNLNDKVIPQIHQKIIKATCGQLITGCEMERIGRAGAIQGALQGLKNLQTLRQEGYLQKKSEKQLIWPFHTAQNVSYKMFIQCDTVIHKANKKTNDF